MNNKYLTQRNWDKLHTYAKGLPKAACTQIGRRYIYIINATLLTQTKPEYLELGTHSHTVWLHVITNKAIKLHVLSQTKKAARVLRIVTSYTEAVPYSVKHCSIVPILFGSSNETEHPLCVLLKPDFKNDSCDFRNLILELSHQNVAQAVHNVFANAVSAKHFLKKLSHLAYHFHAT